MADNYRRSENREAIVSSTGVVDCTGLDGTESRMCASQKAGVLCVYFVYSKRRAGTLGKAVLSIRRVVTDISTWKEGHCPGSVMQTQCLSSGVAQTEIIKPF